MKPLRKSDIILFWVAFATMLVFSVIQISAETCQYDPAGRLISVTYDDGSAIAYTYDNAGNIKKISKPTASGSGDDDVPSSSDNRPSGADSDRSVSSTTTTDGCFVGTLKLYQ